MDAVYHLLTKFVEEDAPTPKELEGIAKGRADFRAGRSYAEGDVDWDNLRGMKFGDEPGPEEKP